MYNCSESILNNVLCEWWWCTCIACFVKWYWYCFLRMDLQKVSQIIQKLKYKALSKHTKHVAVDGQVCFQRQLLLSLSNHEGALQGLWSQWTALIRICALPKWCQWLSQPRQWIVSVSVTYWRWHSTTCVLRESITHLQLPPSPTTRHTWLPNTTVIYQVLP